MDTVEGINKRMELALLHILEWKIPEVESDGKMVALESVYGAGAVRKHIASQLGEIQSIARAGLSRRVEPGLSSEELIKVRELISKVEEPVDAPTRLRYVNEVAKFETKYVEVCTACGTSTCCNGLGRCAGARNAGTELLTVSRLRVLEQEHPDNWSDSKMISIYGSAAPHGYAWV